MAGADGALVYSNMSQCKKLGLRISFTWSHAHTRALQTAASCKKRDIFVKLTDELGKEGGIQQRERERVSALLLWKEERGRLGYDECLGLRCVRVALASERRCGVCIVNVGNPNRDNAAGLGFCENGEGLVGQQA